MSKSLDRLSLLETFARISDRGSISAAARDLGLSQASASRQLRELEDRMGAQLIRRTTHSLALTPAGHAALADARTLLADWDAFEERHTAQGGVIRGPLKVVAPVALGQTHLVDMAARFLIEHPDVTLEWELEDDPIRFAERGCDCWIKIGPVPDDTLIVRTLGQVERIVVAAPELLGNSLKDPQELEAVPFIALAPFEGGNVTFTNNKGVAVPVSLRPRMTTNNIVSILRAVRLGTGAAVMPTWFAATELKDGRLIDLLPGWRASSLSINAAFLPARNQPKRLEAFLQFLCTGVRAIPGVTSHT
ncbi:MAG: LysR family transcriptional regulator [Planctomycetota bacterium]